MISIVACCHGAKRCAHAARISDRNRTISLSCELNSLSKAAFANVRLTQLCTENGISIYMCGAVEVAWLAQNFRHSTARV